MVGIIKNKCIGCGVCANICPEAIEMVNGEAKIKNKNSDCLKEAANSCPEDAILFDSGSENEKDSSMAPSRGSGYVGKSGVIAGCGFGLGGGGNRRRERRRQQGRRW